jgi:hypothetical protein
VRSDVSKEHIASIFGAEEKYKQETSVKEGGKHSCFHGSVLLGLFFDPEDRSDMFQ